MNSLFFGLDCFRNLLTVTEFSKIYEDSNYLKLLTWNCNVVVEINDYELIKKHLHKENVFKIDCSKDISEQIKTVSGNIIFIGLNVELVDYLNLNRLVDVMYFQHFKIQNFDNNIKIKGIKTKYDEIIPVMFENGEFNYSNLSKLRCKNLVVKPTKLKCR